MIAWSTVSPVPPPLCGVRFTPLLLPLPSLTLADNGENIGDDVGEGGADARPGSTSARAESIAVVLDVRAFFCFAIPSRCSGSLDAARFFSPLLFVPPATML